MSVIDSSQLLATGDEGYQISRSVRLRSSATAYFSRTPASTTNQKTYTWSGWIKLGALANGGLIEGYSSSTLLSAFETSSGTLVFQNYNSASYNLVWQTSAVYRDPSAWYHVVLSVDMTQASAANAVKIYVNGVSQAATFNAYLGSYSANMNTYINTVSIPQHIGLYAAQPSYFDGYFAEVNFIDGQALTPSSFGQYNAYGVWTPTKYNGTYGTNGFYLNFSDNSGATSTTIGKDYSGNGNNWTPNNISVTTGVTYDSMTDVPTLNSPTAANYAVWNPLILAKNFDSNSQTIADGNLVSKFTSNTSAGKFGGASTIGVNSGKWYCEMVVTQGGSYPTYSNFGITGDPMYNATTTNASIGQQDYSIGWYNANGNVYRNGSSVFSGSTQSAPYTAMIALDVDAGKIYFGFNGTWINSADPAAGTGGFSILSVASTPTGFYYITCFYASTGMQGSYSLNCGQQPFSYTPPSGYKALNTFNLPTPTIGNGANYMAATTYTGNSSTQSIVNSGNNTTGVTFKPDFVWIKNRTSANGHVLMDSVRGTDANGYLVLASESTAGESAFDTTWHNSYGKMTAINSNGFTVVNGSTTGNFNTSSNNYVGWQWQAGQGSTSSNTSGSITSTVSVNATAGFSIVTYTGTGSAATVGHGLGVTPQMFIVKSRSVATGWPVYHAFDNASPATGYMALQTTDAFFSSTAFNNTAPTSTVFSVGGAGVSTNNSAATYVAYCWAAVAGFSAFGSYTGNGSTDGPFVYCGFRPQYLLIKSLAAGGHWEIIDTSSNPYNVANNQFSGADTATAQYQGYTFGDFLSNGFKIRDNSSGLQGNYNNSNATYIYAAFAENPFKYSLAR